MKRLAVFLDGTWNDPTSKTNVSRLFNLVAPQGSDGTEQRKYYDTGVGTKRFEKLRGGVGAYGLSKNVREAYAWLVANHEPGDQIYVFGFSRGAYTARSVAGMVARYGLLERDGAVDTDQLYDLYRARGKGRPQEGSREFRLRELVKANSRATRIRFVGIWDTVGTLGIPFGNLPGISRRQFRFHNTRPSRKIDEGCQALALDEHRKAYDAVLWTNYLALDPATGKIADIERRAEVHHPLFEQRWFVGAHSNVGGGYPGNVLSLPPLAWIQRRAAGADLDFLEPIALSGDEHLKGELVDSFKKFMKGIYRVLRFGRRHYRPVGRPLERKSGAREGLVETVNETIDLSVLERWRLDASYRPRNLTEHANRAGIDLATINVEDCIKIQSGWHAHQ